MNLDAVLDTFLRVVASFALSVLILLLGENVGTVIGPFVLLLFLDLSSKLYRLIVDAGGIRRIGDALRAGKISSRTMYQKTLRKIVRYTLLAAAGTQLSRMIPPDLVYQGMGLSQVIYVGTWAYLGLTELVSVAENLAGVDGKTEVIPFRVYLQGLLGRAETKQ